MRLFDDSAITKKENDVLGMSQSASSVALEIYDHLCGSKESKKSLVFGILGDWGSGKTSFAELILEELEGLISSQTRVDWDSSRTQLFYFLGDSANYDYASSNESIIEIVRFNAWQYGTQKQLISQFFNNIYNTIDKYSFSLDLSIRKYSDAVLSAFEDSSRIGKIIKIVNKLNEDNSNLSERKRDIDRCLIDNGVHLVIFIDDLDRLLPERVLEVIQFVTDVVDFSNTVFIFAYNEEYITHVLKTEGLSPGLAKKYMEKVVQVPISVPGISQPVIESLFSKYVINNLDEKGITVPLDPGVVTVLCTQIKNLREIKRFANELLLKKAFFEKGLNKTHFVLKAFIELFFIGEYRIIFKNHDTFMLFVNEDSSVKKEMDSFPEILIRILRIFSSPLMNDTGYPITNSTYYDLFFSDSQIRADAITEFIYFCSSAPQNYNLRTRNALISFFDGLGIGVHSFRTEIKRYFTGTGSEKLFRDATNCIHLWCLYFDCFDLVDNDAFDKILYYPIKIDYLISFLYAIKNSKPDENMVNQIRKMIPQLRNKDAVLYLIFYFFINADYVKIIEEAELFTENELLEIAVVFAKAIQKEDSFRYDPMWFSPLFLQFAKKNVSFQSISEIAKREEAFFKIGEFLVYFFNCVDNEIEEMLLFLPISNDHKTVYVRRTQFDDYASTQNEKGLLSRKERLVKMIEEYLKKSNDSINRMKLKALKKYFEISPEKRDHFDYFGISTEAFPEYKRKNRINDEFDGE